MGQKDISEKVLVDYNDVFADILNVCIYNGKEVVKPEELTNTAVHSQYKAEDGKLHEQERDVTKYWKEKNEMIVKRVWFKYHGYIKEKYCEGWFLFGIVPLYIRSRFIR
jgi:hypothetical protein